MTLIKCNKCGHMVSDNAESCPNCGFAVAQDNIPKQETIFKRRRIC